MEQGGALDVLHIEDDALVLSASMRSLRLRGFRATGAESCAAARGVLQRKAADGEVFDAVLLDLKLPDGDGAELIPVISRYHPQAIVAVVSGELDAGRSIDLAGRVAYVIPKPFKGEALGKLAERIVARREARRSRVAAFAAAHGLGPRETLVLGEAVEGRTVKQIAARLGCTPASVYTHWKRIYKKTKLASQAAVLLAVQRDT